jgi:acetylornithine deacetylase/succinyl-diaminopimelate desuccinylase-like protein
MPTDLPADLRTDVTALMPRALADLAELVAIPSIADERIVPLAECDRAADWVAAAFRAEGIQDARPERTPDGTAAVVGHRPGPAGAPTVLLYAHYDVQPTLDEAAWATPPFELTVRDGRYFGRGAADCKGNIAAILTALRALRDEDGGYPVGLRLAIEGSEEQGGGGLDLLVEARPELFAADVVLVVDVGNVAVGRPTLTTSLRGAADVVVHVATLAGPVHSGMFGGAAPDPVAALIAMLATLRDETGGTTVRGLDASGTWPGAGWDADEFAQAAGMLPGAAILGSGSVADQLWARPAVTVVGIDVPPVVGSTPAIQGRVSARLNLRVPPGMSATAARDALIAHLHAVAPWGATVMVESDHVGEPFVARTDTPAFAALSQAMAEAFGAPTVSVGEGASIPLCNVLAHVLPAASIVLLGVEDPAASIHAPNESVHPGEIEHLAHALALFLNRLT